MMGLRQDLILGLRMLAKRPVFTALAVLILALGIGANSAIFSVINGLLLRPLPYPDSGRLVQVWNKYPLMNLPQASVSIPDYMDRRTQVEAFDESCLYFFSSFNLASENQPERVIGVRTTASMFPLLQSAAMLGRAFDEEDDQPGRENVVVISHGLWQRVFGSQPSAVGSEIRLNGEPHQVLGVMPPKFDFPHPDVELWKPFAITETQKSDNQRGREFASMLARLRPGASVELAQQQIDAIHEANKERFPQARQFWENSGFGGMVLPYREQLFGDLEPVLLLLQAMVIFVLLIACANVANLLLTRVQARQREISVRSALGAGRWRLARQFLVESLMLALAGGVLGILFGFVGVDLVAWLGLEEVTRGIDISIDASVLAFTFLLAVLTGVVFGLFPVISMWRSNPADVLHEMGRGNSARLTVRSALVVCEVALALVLLAGTGLLGQSFLRLASESPGFNPQNVLLAEVSLPSSKYSDEQAVAFFDRALEKIRTLAGVRSAAIISESPFSGSSSSGSYQIDGYTPGEGESAPHAFFRMVDPEYFRTMEIPILEGRSFVRNESRDVAVVDQTFVDKYSPNESAIGKRVGRGGPNGQFFEIVGVVRPVKIQTLEQPVTKETIYLSFAQRSASNMNFVVKSELPPSALTASLRQAVLELDPELPLYNLVTMQRQLLDTLSTRRVSVALLIAFAALALVLATVGIYGVVAFSVSQRTREMGTRMALGAGTGHILSLILRQEVLLTVIGVALGIAASLGLSRFVSSMLFGVSAWDPLTFSAAGAFLLLVALAACYRPARKATRVDPVEALRYE